MNCPYFKFLMTAIPGSMSIFETCLEAFCECFFHFSNSRVELFAFLEWFNLFPYAIHIYYVSFDNYNITAIFATNLLYETVKTTNGNKQRKISCFSTFVSTRLSTSASTLELTSLCTNQRLCVTSRYTRGLSEMLFSFTRFARSLQQQSIFPFRRAKS